MTVDIEMKDILHLSYNLIVNKRLEQVKKETKGTHYTIDNEDPIS